MQIATWNINSLRVRLPQVLAWLESSNCDILTLQELKLENADFPVAAFAELGYQCAFNGQKTYNGVAIVSKLPIQEVCYDIPAYVDLQKRVISASINDIRIMCVYVVNGESINSVKYQYKLIWLEELRRHIADTLKQYSKVVVLGDFNIAPQDIDVYDPPALSGHILCSEPERKAWNSLLELGLYDSFRLFNSEDRQYTWWDYRNFAFRRKMGLRIDHILINGELKRLATTCEIDTLPRKNERPSDHAPVILTLSV
jgi:exodeoxyribonuclease-3